MKFKTLLGAMAIIAEPLVQPVCAAQVPERAFSPGTSTNPRRIPKAAIMPHLGVVGAQGVIQIAQRRRRRAARNVIGGAAAGAIIGGLVDGRRGARTGAVIGGTAGAVRAAKRSRYRKWRRGRGRRWRRRGRR